MFFFFRRQCCTSALLRVSTTAPKRMLFKNADFWWFQALFNHFFVFWKQYCASAQLRGTIVPKKAVQQCQGLMLFGLVELFLFSGGNVVLRRCWWLVHQCRKNANFDDFWALLIFFPASRLYLALVVVGTRVPKQWLFIIFNFWWLLAQLKVVLFFGGNVVFRHCWALVQQRRKECCSKMPIFDDFKHCLTIFLFFGSSIVLQHSWGVQ